MYYQDPVIIKTLSDFLDVEGYYKLCRSLSRRPNIDLIMEKTSKETPERLIIPYFDREARYVSGNTKIKTREVLVDKIMFRIFNHLFNGSKYFLYQHHDWIVFSMIDSVLRISLKYGLITYHITRDNKTEYHQLNIKQFYKIYFLKLEYDSLICKGSIEHLPNQFKIPLFNMKKRNGEDQGNEVNEGNEDPFNSTLVAENLIVQLKLNDNLKTFCEVNLAIRIRNGFYKI